MVLPERLKEKVPVRVPRVPSTRPVLPRLTSTRVYRAGRVRAPTVTAVVWVLTSTVAEAFASVKPGTEKAAVPVKLAAIPSGATARVPVMPDSVTTPPSEAVTLVSVTVTPPGPAVRSMPPVRFSPSTVRVTEGARIRTVRAARVPCVLAVVLTSAVRFAEKPTPGTVMAPVKLP